MAQISAPKNVSWVLPLLDVRHCCKLSLYAILSETNGQTQEDYEKCYFGPDLGLLDSNSDCEIFFSKIWFCQPLDIIANYHHIQYH